MIPIPQGTDYRLIGKLLLIRMPEVAEDLLKIHQDEKAKLDEAKPLEIDHEKIFLYFINFCKIKKREPFEYIGYTRDRNRVAERLEFVAVILHLYNPSLFVASKEFLLLKGYGIAGNGLTRSLSRVLSVYDSNACRMVRQVIFMEKTYEDFKEKVNELFNKLSRDGAEVAR